MLWYNFLIKYIINDVVKRGGEMKISSALKKLRPYIINDNIRIRIQFLFVYAALSVIALIMSIVNIFTHQYSLMISTFAFSILCIFNLLLSVKKKIDERLSVSIFIIAFLCLFLYFIISGNPEGFSVIWICLLPSWGILLLGRKRGSIICALVLAIIAFFFDTNIGLNLLQYQYTESFKMRFPLLYISFYLVGFLLETIRVMTHDELVEVQDKYKYLYSHDALTGVFNRYGFNEYMDATLKNSSIKKIALIIIDVDKLKIINDEHGHIKGDTVLKSVSDTLVKNVPPGSAVCRWGGDEFAILLNDYKNLKFITENLCLEIRNTPITSDNETINVTASLGVVLADCDANCTSAKLINCADNCLYCAKRNGRNKVVFAELVNN